MSRDVLWDREILRMFREEAILSAEQDAVLMLHVRGWSRVAISMELHMGLSTVDKRIAELKAAYDQCQARNGKLPKRKTVTRREERTAEY